MRRVYKYPLRFADFTSVKMPKDACVLTVQYQGTRITLWALVNSETEHVTRERVFRIAGTGHDLAEDAEVLSYIGTVQQPVGGSYVWHIFEIIPQEEA